MLFEFDLKFTFIRQLRRFIEDELVIIIIVITIINVITIIIRKASNIYLQPLQASNNYLRATCWLPVLLVHLMLFPNFYQFFSRDLNY